MALAYAARQLGSSVPGLLAPWSRALQTSALVSQVSPEPVPLSQLKDSFNDATSVNYLEELEQRYRNDPSSVDGTWASFFRNIGTRPHAMCCAALWNVMTQSRSLSVCA